jgi:hypothetical protein
MQKIVSLCKRRGFVFPAGEIYGCMGAAYDYGPYGSQLKKNIKDIWWKSNIERRPDVIQYMLSSENNKNEVDDEKKPILKKDGEVFIEAYFELEKSPLPPIERDMLEHDAKENNWSYRELKEAIKNRIEETRNPGTDWYQLQEAREKYISEIIAIIKSMPTEKLPNIIKLLESYRKQNESQL